MRGIIAAARAYLAVSLRERVTLFWFLIFPVFLFVILALIFSSTGKQGTMNFKIAVVNEGKATIAGPDFAAIVVHTFDSLSTASSGQEPLFTLLRPHPGETTAAFRARADAALNRERITAVVVIPPGFNSAMVARLHTAHEAPVPIKVIVNNSSEASRVAAGIITGVISGIDREVLIRAGRYVPSDETKPVTEWTGKNKHAVSYASFLLPGVILMAFFTSGLFGVPGTILYSRDRHILQRYFVTPFTPLRYLMGFSIGQLGLCLLQFALLYAIGRFWLGAQVNFGRPGAILFLVLGFFTFLAFGFLVAALAKTGDGGMAIGNLLNIPLIFLGGLFFPVGNLPLALKVVVFANPVTYIAAGLRMTLGLGGEGMPLVVSIVVPIAWIGICSLIAARRISWGVQ